MSTELSSTGEYAIIVAMTADGVIGDAGRLPWHDPEELQLFRRLTLGTTLIMGRRTYAAIGRPLPERHNIVISSTQPEQPGLIVVPDFASALHQAGQIGRPVFFIGGAQVYRMALAIAGHLHISWIVGDYPGDTRFPAFDRAAWVSCAEEQHAGFRYIHYRRKVLSPES